MKASWDLVFSNICSLLFSLALQFHVEGIQHTLWGIAVEFSCQPDLTILPSSRRTNHNLCFFITWQTRRMSGRVWPVSDMGMHKERGGGISPGTCVPRLLLLTSGPQSPVETKRAFPVLTTVSSSSCLGAQELSLYLLPVQLKSV